MPPPDTIALVNSPQQYQYWCRRNNSQPEALSDPIPSFGEGSSKRNGSKQDSVTPSPMALSKAAILKKVETGLTRQNINNRSEWGWTSLMFAAASGQGDLARALISAKADVHLRNWKGWTALHVACCKGQVGMAELLIDNGSNLDEQDEEGKTPLMFAAEMGHSNVVKMLILAGAKVGLGCVDSRTALHYAAEGNHIDCGTLLVEAGADITAADVKVRTPLDNASVEFREAIQRTLARLLKQVVVVAGGADQECSASTLMSALQEEERAFSKKLTQQHAKVSQAPKGLPSTELAQLLSPKYRETQFYNFEGQAGYQTAHQPFLEAMLNKMGGSATLLLLVKASEDEDGITQQLHRWLQPLALASSPSTPQVIVAGSYLGRGESKKQAYERLQRCIQSIQEELHVQIKGHTIIESCNLQGEGIKELSRLVRNTSQSRQVNSNIPYNLSWIVSELQSSVMAKALQMHEFAKWMDDAKTDLPRTLPSPEKMCQDMSAAGYALFLPNRQDPSQSWLILDLPALLHDVKCILFSGSEGSVNQFGLLHCSQLTKLFPEFDQAMIQDILINLEFCKEIDPLLLKEEMAKSIAMEKGEKGWLYFPALVLAQAPEVFPDNRDPQLLQWMCWQLRTAENQFISSHLLQTIILRLATKHVSSHKLLPGVREHSCNVWMNGISWSSTEGVDIAVQISDSSVIQVVGRSKAGSEELHQYTTTIARDIRKAIAQLSPKLEATSYIVHPYTPAMWMDPKAPPHDVLYPISSIDRSISDGEEHVLSLPRDPGRVHQQMSLKGLFGGCSPSLSDVQDFARYSAECALDEHCWIPHGIQSLSIDCHGGEFQLEPLAEEEDGEEATSIEVPPGAINQGTHVEIRYAVIPDGPFLPPPGYQFGSMVAYIYYNGQSVTKPLTLHLPRWYGGFDHAQDGVSLAMAPHTLKEGEEEYRFKLVEEGTFGMPVRRQCGSHDITGHCSLFVEVFRLGSTPTYYTSLWTNQYLPIQQHSKIVITYAHGLWLKLVAGYWKGWKRADKRVLAPIKFSFTSTDKKVRAVLGETHGRGWTASIVGGENVRCADVAYHGKYSQKKLQEEVEEQIYPPSVHCTVTYRSPPGSSGHNRRIGMNIEGTEKGRLLIPIEVVEMEESLSTLYPASDLTLRNLDESIVDTIASRWDAVALHLGVQPSCIEVVRRDNPSSCQGACRDVLDRWLQGDRNTGKEERSWSSLQKALVTSGYERLAVQLRWQMQGGQAEAAQGTVPEASEVFPPRTHSGSVPKPLGVLAHQRLQTIKLDTVKDATLQTGANLGSFQYLLVGLHKDYPKKRFVIQFEDIPRYCTSVVRAVMYLKYAYAHKASWMSFNEAPYITRQLCTHQILRPWDEQEIYSTYMSAGFDYIPDQMEVVALPYEGNEGQLANGYVPFNIIQAARNWVSGAANYGILVMDLLEDRAGRDRRFWSREGPPENRPYLEVTYHSNDPPPATATGEGAPCKVSQNYLS